MILIHYRRDGSHTAGPFHTSKFAKRWIKWALIGATDIKLEMV